MKKTLLVVVALLGMQLGALAQDTIATPDKGNFNLFLSAGASFTDFKFNDKLKASGLPEINTVAPMIGIGFNATAKEFLVDFEWNTSYFSDKKTPAQQVRTLTTGFDFRLHYLPWNTGNTFFSAGVDLSYYYTQNDIFTRGNVIDLNDLDPATHTGHISLYSNTFYAGPSVSLGLFQKSEWPVRITTGYGYGLLGGKWKSEVAAVNNSVRESGNSRAYVKVILYM
ncbi:MAG: hypothetical protein EOP54_18285 [Sphingobacteriales bacterium]|nr:MAG: hypothetical protein EOP54_18285 [Sphingobacteriales bacterium]